MTRVGDCGAENGYALVRSNTAASHPAAHREGRAAVLDRLRSKIQQIENRTPALVSNDPSVKARFADGSPPDLPVEDGGTHPRNARCVPSSSPPGAALWPRSHATWTLGDGTLDDWLGPLGLETDAIHEIKPQLRTSTDPAQVAQTPIPDATANWAAAWSAARAFLLTLLLRRLQSEIQRMSSGASILWCWPRIFAQEFGELYAPGLEHFGIARDALIIVEPTRAQDVLWAMEEGFKSRSVVCVVGILDDVDLTPARRLALAAQRYRVPGLVLTSPRMPAMAATATRWRVAAAPGAAHPIAPGLPGALRLRLSLERCRALALAGAHTPVTAEWCEDTARFRLSPPVRSSEERAPAHAATAWSFAP